MGVISTRKEIVEKAIGNQGINNLKRGEEYDRQVKGDTR